MAIKLTGEVGEYLKLQNPSRAFIGRGLRAGVWGFVLNAAWETYQLRANYSDWAVNQDMCVELEGRRYRDRYDECRTEAKCWRRF